MRGRQKTPNIDKYHTGQRVKKAQVDVLGEGREGDYLGGSLGPL